MKKMSTLMKSILMLGTLFTSLILFQACDSNDDENITLSSDEELDIVENSNDAENTIDEDLQVMSLEQTTSSGGRIAGETCAVVTKDETAKTITIDFGDGCVGPYGRERSGKIIITYGGTFDDDMANRVITFEDYYVNNKNITGTVALRDINRNDDGNLTATRELVDYAIHFPDGNSFTLNGSTTREWLEGEGDSIITNDVFRITGAYEGVSTRGRTFSHEIVEPIIADFNCRASGGFLRVAGVREMRISKVDRERVRTIDYGDGECDNEITVTINGKVFTITAS